MKKPKRKIAKKVTAKKTGRKLVKKLSKAVAKKSTKKISKKSTAKEKRPAAKMQHPFIWHDLMTPDVAAAKKFYGDVVGWTFSDNMPNYTVNLAGGFGMGGIMEMPAEMKGMPPVWTGYVYVPNVDAACKQAVKLGGKILRPAWDVPEVGRMAVIGDSTGASLIIMKPARTGAQPLPKPGAMGTLGWNELHADDLGKAWNFYSKMFGWSKGETMNMGAMGNYQLFQIKKQDLGGMMKKSGDTPRATWAYYFMVDGIDAAVSRLTNGGGKVTMGPHQVPGGQWVVMATDPHGGSFALTSENK